MNLTSLDGVLLGAGLRREGREVDAVVSFAVEWGRLGVEALGPSDADLDVEVVSLAADFFAGLGLRQVVLKLHSMGDGTCRPGYVALLSEFLVREKASLPLNSVAGSVEKSGCCESI